MFGKRFCGAVSRTVVNNDDVHFDPAQVRLLQTVQAAERELLPVVHRCDYFDLQIRHSILIIKLRIFYEANVGVDHQLDKFLE
jgi:hypothetical protein